MPEVARGQLPEPSQPEFFSPQPQQTDPPAVVLNVAETQNPTAPPTITFVEKVKSPLPEADELASERGINYSKLRDLLKAGKWRAADEETLRVMLKAANCESSGWLDFGDLEKFPCKDLKTIDLLWVTASNGHFGFSVQKKIWEECGSPMSDNDDWSKFLDLVGWRRKGESNYNYYNKLKFALNFSPAGELPRKIGEGGVALFSRKEL